MAIKLNIRIIDRRKVFKKKLNYSDKLIVKLLRFYQQYKIDDFMQMSTKTLSTLITGMNQISAEEHLYKMDAASYPHYSEKYKPKHHRNWYKIAYPENFESRPIKTTDLELIPDKPIEFGVQNFCERCLKCADFCPSKAISREGKINIRAVEKWDFKIEQCYQIWRLYGTDCGICMKVCPFSHPDNFVHNTVRYGIKTSAFAREISLRGDDFIYGKHKRQ